MSGILDSLSTSWFTFSPSGVCLHNLVHVCHVLEPLLLQLPELVRVATLVSTKQQQVQHHSTTQTTQECLRTYPRVVRVEVKGHDFTAHAYKPRGNVIVNCSNLWQQWDWGRNLTYLMAASFVVALSEVHTQNVEPYWNRISQKDVRVSWAPAGKLPRWFYV